MERYLITDTAVWSKIDLSGKDEGVIREYQNDDLSIILNEWKQTCNGSIFCLDCDPLVTAEHLSKINKLFVMIVNEKVVGLIGIQIFKNPIGNGMMANEHLWYVCKAYRGSGISLLEHGMKWATEQGCTHFMATASNLASDLHDSICKLYEVIGMRKFETTFIKKLGG